MYITANNPVRMEPFFIEFEQLYLHGDMLVGENSGQPNLLFLHGLRSCEGRGNFLLLRQFLLKQYGLSSCIFDFIGHGSTGGNLASTSLRGRTRQADEVVNACFDSQPFSIVAVGMGAHTALKLTEVANVQHLVLLAPEIACNGSYLAPFSEVDMFGREECPVGLERGGVVALARRFQGNLAVMTDCGPSHTPVARLLCAQGGSLGVRQLLDTPGGHPGWLMHMLGDQPAVLAAVARTIAVTLGVGMSNVKKC